MNQIGNGRFDERSRNLCPLCSVYVNFRMRDYHYVTGCSAAHPRAILAAFASTLQAAPRWLAAALNDERPSQRQYAIDDLKRTLQALTVLCRSRINRAQLSAMDTLPSLRAVLQIMGQRVNTLAAVTAVSAGSLEKVQPQLTAVWDMMKEIAAAIGAFLERTFLDNSSRLFFF